MEYDDVLTRNSDGELAVRTVSATEQSTVVNPNDVYTRDTDGNLCIRIAGSGGGSVDETKVIVLSDTIPTADADSLGKFYCYKGTTNSSYTHGYIYECVENEHVYTDSVEYEPATLSGTVVTSTSGALSGLCATYIQGDITTITNGTLTYDSASDLWRFVGKDEEDNVVGTFQIYQTDYEDAGFTFTGTPEEGDVVAFTCSIEEVGVPYSWERVDVQPVAKLGRYLSGWNCATGLAMTNPQESPYEYTTGDYFIVGVVATGGATNYKPNGSSYTIGVASTTVESETVNVNDTYLYDGTSWTLLKTGSAVTSINGQTGDVNIKTVNSNSLMGSGNLELSTYLTYPNTWATNSTTKAFCDDIAADTTATVGKAYLGEVIFSDLPASMVNGEVIVEIMSGTTSANKVIVLSLKSGNVSPYAWQYVYWDGGTNVSGWKTFGDTLPSQTGNAGKFLTTDGTDISWSDKPIVNASNQSTSLTILGTASIKSYTTNIGYESKATQNNSTAVGAYSQATGSGSTAFGRYTTASGNASVCIGNYSTASGANSIVIGLESTASAANSIEISTKSGYTNSDANTFKVGNNNGNFEIMSADGTVPADRLVNSINKYSTMPIAASTNEGWIVQYTGTTDANYTHGYIYECKAQGTTPDETYAWEEVTIQASGLPSQAGNSGKFLTTNGTNASWSNSKVLINSVDTSNTTSINIDGVNTGTQRCVSVGKQASSSEKATAVGYNSYSGQGSCALGYEARTFRNYQGFSTSVAIGFKTTVGAHNAIQLGTMSVGNNSGIATEIETINTDANTFKVANVNGNFEMMSADGTIPTARLTKVDTTITLAAANWSSNTQTVNVTGMTATGVVIVRPDPAYQGAYFSAGILCTAQAAGTLTFTCDTTPSSDINVNVVML